MSKLSGFGGEVAYIRIREFINQNHKDERLRTNIHVRDELFLFIYAASVLIEINCLFALVRARLFWIRINACAFLIPPTRDGGGLPPLRGGRNPGRMKKFSP